MHYDMSFNLLLFVVVNWTLVSSFVHFWEFPCLIGMFPFDLAAYYYILELQLYLVSVSKLFTIGAYEKDIHIIDEGRKVVLGVGQDWKQNP